ncbi:hypothetical protein [Intestinimonas butyriciproducens]|uniref:hypothetical protein n=1 Tax=Intestinimonas butyriciproducens TaxID=1297617 RepID=UPI00068C645F|nr:hypothetical protein [Intestinimonas butyriciproducens]
MAASKATSTSAAAVDQGKKTPALFEVGELRSKHKVGRAVFAGVCSAQDWKPGKAVTEEEFLEAVKKFENAPMKGEPRKEGKK